MSTGPCIILELENCVCAVLIFVSTREFQNDINNKCFIRLLLQKIEKYSKFEEKKRTRKEAAFKFLYGNAPKLETTSFCCIFDKPFSDVEN